MSMLLYGDRLVSRLRDGGYSVYEIEARTHIRRKFESVAKESVFSKLISNIDKYFFCLFRVLIAPTRHVHIVDQSNFFYYFACPFKKVSITVHDIIPVLARKKIINGYRPSIAAKTLQYLMCFVLRRIDTIICVSYATKSDLVEHLNVRSERIVVIHNCVLEERSDQVSEQSLRAKLNIPKHNKVVLCIGSTFYKNHPRSLKAFDLYASEIDDCCIVLLGRADHLIRSLQVKSKFSERIRIVSGLSGDEVGALLKTASVLCFPSLYEGFGLPVLEAQISSTPVVTSHAGALKEVAENSCIVVDPLDVAQIAAAIKRVLLDETLAANLAELGLINSKRFSVRSWAEKHTQFFSNLLDTSLN